MWDERLHPDRVRALARALTASTGVAHRPVTLLDALGQPATQAIATVNDDRPAYAGPGAPRPPISVYDLGRAKRRRVGRYWTRRTAEEAIAAREGTGARRHVVVAPAEWYFV